MYRLYVSAYMWERSNYAAWNKRRYMGRVIHMQGRCEYTAVNIEGTVVFVGKVVSLMYVCLKSGTTS